MDNEHPNLVSGLIRKRAELSGELITAEKRIAQLHVDIDAMDRAIRVFDPSATPETIRAVIRRGPVLFRRGEFIRAILKTLREAPAAMTARGIVEVVAREAGMSADARTMDKMAASARNLLSRARDGVTSSRVDGVVYWRRDQS
jgi:hypothetical protein